MARATSTIKGKGKAKAKGKAKGKGKARRAGAAAAAPARRSAPKRKAPAKSKRAPAAAVPHHERVLASPIVTALGHMMAGLLGAALLDVAARAEGVTAGPVGPGTVVGLAVGGAGLSGALSMSDSKTAIGVGAGALALPLLRLIDSEHKTPEPKTDADWLVLIERQYGREAAQLVAQNAGYLPAPAATAQESIVEPASVPAEA